MSNGSDIPAPKGKPKAGPAKTTVNKAIPVEITPTKAEFVIVLDKTGAVRAAYPILNFDVKGPPGWFFEVQVARKDSSPFTAGPGLAGSWDKTKDPKDRLPQAAFSSWTNGETTLKFDGAGKAKYTMPLDWWKDQARQPRKTFVEDYFYRALGFKDTSGASPRFSTPNGGAAPSVKVHNNLVDFTLTDLGWFNGEIEKHEQVQFAVREPNTTDMYTVVQWLTGSGRVWGGSDTYSFLHHYDLDHRNYYSEWAIDSSTTNPRPNFFGGSAGPVVSGGGKIATGIDPPGGPIRAETHKFFAIDFETRVHLNFEVPASVTIKKQVGSAEPYDELIGVMADPQPFILDSGTWKIRVLQIKKDDGTVDVSHPDTYAGPPPPPKSGCFIATAAHGSEMVPEVQFLRDIRDRVLRPTRWGREFFENYWKHYYRISPAIAEEMSRDQELRRIIRWSIVDPWTFYLKLAVTRPDWDRISFDSLDPALRDFLLELRKDMDRWLEAIEVPKTFAGLDPVNAVRELNVALDFVRRTGGLAYLDQLMESGALPLRYRPDEEAVLLSLLRGAGRSPDQISRILYGSQEPKRL